MNIIERVKNIILKPKEEWTVISQETTTANQIVMNYLMVLALIPAIGQFVRFGLIGYNIPFYGHVAGNMEAGIRYAIIAYISGVAGAYISAFIIDALATNFSSQKDSNKSMQLVVYAYTPMMLAGVFYLIPGLTFLGIVGLYGLYILYLGLKPMMLTPDDKVTSYFVVSLLVIIAVYFVLGLILGAILLAGTFATTGMHL
jgi:hypothetical protein